MRVDHIVPSSGEEVAESGGKTIHIDRLTAKQKLRAQLPGLLAQNGVRTSNAANVMVKARAIVGFQYVEEDRLDAAVIAEGADDI